MVNDTATSKARREGVVGTASHHPSGDLACYGFGMTAKFSVWRWRSTRCSGLKLSIVLVAAGLMAGCASQRVRDCESIAGSGWQELKAPPADAAHLLALQGVPDSESIVWLSRDADHVLACSYQIGLVSPGCSNSRAYEFARGAKGWTPKGILMSACNAEQ